MTFEEFLAECSREQTARPGKSRWGQTIFNRLAIANTQLAAEIHSTPMDPYYWPEPGSSHDPWPERWDRLYAHLQKKWELTTDNG